MSAKSYLAPSMMTASAFPAWPEDIPTHPLLVLDYQRLKSRDFAEIERLWGAATTIGFWYLKNHETEDVVEDMFALGAEVMALPTDKLMEYEQGDEGESFGYKRAGADVVSATGELDTAEFLNISKDDALAWPNLVRRKHPSYPRPILNRMESTIRPFMSKSVEVTNTIIEIFNEKLDMANGTLSEMHSDIEWSGSQARIIRNRATSSTTKMATGSHTDFGSLSILHNRQGGLQVLPPGCDSWQYVKPIPRHAICNIGDALSILSGGLLRSNIHRVLPPPSTQANTERWSLVFFARPGDSVVLRALVDESPRVAAIVKEKHARGERLLEPGVTAREWTQRRVKNRRAANRKGPDTWEESRGTERIDKV